MNQTIMSPTDSFMQPTQMHLSWLYMVIFFLFSFSPQRELRWWMLLFLTVFFFPFHSHPRRHTYVWIPLLHPGAETVYCQSIRETNIIVVYSVWYNFERDRLWMAYQLGKAITCSNGPELAQETCWDKIPVWGRGLLWEKKNNPCEGILWATDLSSTPCRFCWFYVGFNYVKFFALIYRISPKVIFIFAEISHHISMVV